MKHRITDIIFILIISAVILLDQFTKQLIMDNFSLHEHKIVIPGFFNLVYVTNTGAAFGFLAGEQAMWRQVFFVTVAIVALLIMIFAYRHVKNQGRLFVFSIALIAGGAVGNLIDRLRFGAVVDFLDFYVSRYHWPAFNVADSAITVGVGLFLLGMLLGMDKEKNGVNRHVEQ